jgi:aspartyl-tRNA(Asn)/glutamyl-tRNA(Gln) amidotransferase subunit B
MADAATQLPWEAVIGLETHVQLGTDSKIFHGCIDHLWR